MLYLACCWWLKGKEKISKASHSTSPSPMQSTQTPKLPCAHSWLCELTCVSQEMQKGKVMFYFISLVSQSFIKYLLFNAICWDYIQTNVGGIQHSPLFTTWPILGACDCFTRKKILVLQGRSVGGVGSWRLCLLKYTAKCLPSPCRWSAWETCFPHSLPAPGSTVQKAAGPQVCCSPKKQIQQLSEPSPCKIAFWAEASPSAWCCQLGWDTLNFLLIFRF